MWDSKVIPVVGQCDCISDSAPNFNLVKDQYEAQLQQLVNGQPLTNRVQDLCTFSKTFACVPKAMLQGIHRQSIHRKYGPATFFVFNESEDGFHLLHVLYLHFR